VVLNARELLLLGGAKVEIILETPSGGMSQELYTLRKAQMLVRRFSFFLCWQQTWEILSRTSSSSIIMVHFIGVAFYLALLLKGTKVFLPWWLDGNLIDIFVASAASSSSSSFLLLLTLWRITVTLQSALRGRPTLCTASKKTLKKNSNFRFTARALFLSVCFDAAVRAAPQNISLSAPRAPFQPQLRTWHIFWLRAPRKVPAASADYCSIAPRVTSYHISKKQRAKRETMEIFSLRRD
jgi:hypothetical protein